LSTSICAAKVPGAAGSFDSCIKLLGFKLLQKGDPVDTGHWQALTDVPQTKTIELRAATLVYDMPDNAGRLLIDTQPNMPWAEDHFQERVAGEPLNPGKEYKNWPYYRGNVEKHKEQGQFSHTYMERFWPRQANINRKYRREGRTTHGIRYRYGDLNDVVQLLMREPHTRQAYLPVWFPEDTGAHHGERVPCTLGYHFMLREGRLHTFYPIRSCDFLRHFRDDVYLAVRLTQWLIDELRMKEEEKLYRDEVTENSWSDVFPGELTMFMHSLHIFEGDVPMMRKKYAPGT
jgi:thymidylate synthase